MSTWLRVDSVPRMSTFMNVSWAVGERNENVTLPARPGPSRVPFTSRCAVPAVAG